MERREENRVARRLVPALTAASVAALIAAVLAVMPASADEVDLDIGLSEGFLDFGGDEILVFPDGTQLTGDWNGESGALDADLTVPSVTVVVPTGQFGDVPVEIDFGVVAIDGTMDPDSGVVEVVATLQITFDVAFQPGPCTVGPFTAPLDSEPPGYPWRADDESVGMASQGLHVGAVSCEHPSDPHDLVATAINETLGLPTQSAVVVLAFGTEPPPPPPTTTSTTTTVPSGPIVTEAPGDSPDESGVPDSPDVERVPDRGELDEMAEAAVAAEPVSAVPSFAG